MLNSRSSPVSPRVGKSQAMASGTNCTDADHSKCGVCRQRFTEPKLLPCGHLLCRHCVLTWMRTQDLFDCPLCGTTIVDLETRQLKTLEEIAHDLPTDVSMEAMVHADYLLSQDHTCQVCENVAASSMCLNCGDMLCKACKRAHSKLSALKHHRVEDLSELTKETVIAYDLSTCSQHPEETAKLFCLTHNHAICHQCVASEHKDCLEVEDLEEKMEEAHEALADMAHTLTTGESNLQWAIKELDNHLKKTEQRMKAAISEIEDMCNKLETAVKQNRRRLKDMMVEAFCDVKEAVDEGKGSLRGRQDKFSSHKNVIRRAQDLKNYENVHILRPLIEARIQDLDYSTALPSTARTICNMHFAINHDAVARIIHLMRDLGQLQIFPVQMFADQLPALQFHERHGSNVTLTNNNRTAERTEDSRSDNAIVLSSEPLHFDILYEVRLDKWENTYVQGSMCVGVLTQNPFSASLPAWSGHLKSSAIVIRNNWVKNCVTGSQVGSAYGYALGTVGVGSRVGVALDSSRCLHLYVDGSDQGVAARDVPRPCYALFDVCDDVTQVTALPVTRLAERDLGSTHELLSIPSRETTM